MRILDPPRAGLAGLRGEGRGGAAAGCEAVGRDVLDVAAWGDSAGGCSTLIWSATSTSVNVASEANELPSGIVSSSISSSAGWPAADGVGSAIGSLAATWLEAVVSPVAIGSLGGSGSSWAIGVPVTIGWLVAVGWLVVIAWLRTVGPLMTIGMLVISGSLSAAGSLLAMG